MLLGLCIPVDFKNQTINMIQVQDFSFNSSGSGLEMCPAFTAAACSCCLFVVLSPCSFVFNHWKAALLGWGQVTGLALKNHNSLPWKTLWLLLWYALPHPFALWRTDICSIWLNVSGEYSPVDFRIYPAISISSHIINHWLKYMP